MCKCEKCGAKTCSDCGSAECYNGREECLSAKVRRLEQEVRELKARPPVVINPPFYVYPHTPCYVPQPTPWRSPFWYGTTTVNCAGNVAAAASCAIGQSTVYLTSGGN